MTDTLTLLAMPDADAQRQMVQDALIPGVSVADLALGAHTAQGLDMKVRVYVPAATAAREDWPYQGEVDFLFHRMDLQEFFDGIELKFVMPFPTTASAIAAKLATIFNVRFDLDDHVEESIDPTNNIVDYYFRAAAESQRWVGRVKVRLYRQQEESTP
jgi:hypothetical protein